MVSDPAKVLKPRGRLGMMFAAMVVVTLPVLYLALLLGLGLLLGVQGHRSVNNWASNQWDWMHDGKWAVLASLGLIGWLCMFRPLFVRKPRKPASLEIKQASQLDLYQLLGAVSRSTGAKMPVEVRLDCSMGVRLALKNGLWSLLGQREVLTLGLPLAAGTTARQFAGAIANAMGRYPRGIHGRCAHLTEAVNTWLGWAVLRDDPWERALLAARSRRKKEKNFIKCLLLGFMWLTQRPIWLFMMVARAVSARPLRNVTFNGDHAEALLSGSRSFGESLSAAADLQAAWEAACASVHASQASARLPDNFPQAVARHCSNARASSDAAQKLAAGSAFVPDNETRLKRVVSLNLPGVFPAQGNGASLLRDFTDLARQASQIHYQHDLGLNISQFRLVAADESLNQKRRSGDLLAPVKRYFSGLVHPERGLCGEETELSIVPDAAAFRIAIKEGRQWIMTRGDQMRATLREWHMSWQRIRDLEMAHAFALAGIPVDSHQYGIPAHEPALYREEIERQTIVMDASEDPLFADESSLETRFAAALGLLWQTPVESIAPGLAATRAAVPEHVAVYQALVDRLRPMRDLVTLFSAFEALGAKFGGSTSSSAQISAHRFLVPRVMLHAQKVLRGLENIACPSDISPQPRSIAARILEGVSPAAIQMLGMDWEHTQPQSIGHDEALRAGEILTPLTDHFVEIYHRTFAWLASAAEMAEMHLVDYEEQAGGDAGADGVKPSVM